MGRRRAAEAAQEADEWEAKAAATKSVHAEEISELRARLLSRPSGSSHAEVQRLCGELRELGDQVLATCQPQIRLQQEDLASWLRGFGHALATAAAAAAREDVEEVFDDEGDEEAKLEPLSCGLDLTHRHGANAPR